MRLNSTLYMGALFASCLLCSSRAFCEDVLIPAGMHTCSSAEEVWGKLASSPVLLAKEAGKSGFIAEFIEMTEGVIETRKIVDCQLGNCCSVGMLPGGIGGYKYRERILGMDTGHIVEMKSDFPDQDRDELPAVNYWMMVEAIEPSFHWDHRTRGYIRKAKGDISCRVILRTPSDSERWGCGWQSVSVWRKRRCLTETRRVVIGEDSEHRLKVCSADWFDAWLKEHLDLPALDQMLSLFSRVTYQGDVRVRSALRADKDTLFGAGELYESLDVAEGHERDPEYEARVREAAITFYSCVQSQIPVWMTQKANYFLGINEIANAGLTIDDPAMRYWRAELIIGPHQVPYLSRILREYLLRNKHLPLDVRLNACATISELGSPAALYEPFSLIEDRLLCEAVLFSRWQYPIEDEHVDACVKYLNQPDRNPICDTVLIESLLRINEIKRTPPPLLETWWTSQVVTKCIGIKSEYFDVPNRPKTHARYYHTEVWETLCCLSRTPTGRAFLLKRLDSTDPKVLKSAILKNLRLRAESTVRTKRFDFMTEAECQTVLAIPEPPVLGKDTEDGAARPFPKDE